MTRSQVSLTVLGVAALLLLVVAPSVLFVLVAAVLLALFLRGGGTFVSRHLPVGDKAGVGLFLVALLVAGVGLSLAFAPAISDQIDDLAAELPEAFGALRQKISSIGWLNRAIDAVIPPKLPEGAAASTVSTGLAHSLAAIGGFVVLGFIALYVSLNPRLYRHGLLCLLAPAIRPRADQVLHELADTLRGWIVARLFSMAVVGVLTTLGLWAAGIPLAPALGLISALLGFIPNLGPVLAAVPALMLAAVQGGQSVAIVAAIYIAVQMVETYGLTPLVEQKQASLAPALVLGAQLLMGSLYGIFGLAIASPLAAITLVLLREVYVGDYLERSGGADPDA